MSFFKTTRLYNFFSPVLILSLFTFSCTTDNTLMGSEQDHGLEKPFNADDIFSDDDDEIATEDAWRFTATRYFLYLIMGYFSDQGIPESERQKFPILGCLVESIIKIGFGDSNQNTNINNQIAYDFRDNYLSKSEKGEIYTLGYYLLSNYAIENNLLMRNSLEHLSLMNLGIEVSYELQHGTNDNKILINRSIYNDCKDLVKIYRNSEKHADIDMVLDYLEADLEKYYNKSKAVISADFQ